jgi:hypothetical protein
MSHNHRIPIPPGAPGPGAVMLDPLEQSGSPRSAQTVNQSTNESDPSPVGKDEISALRALAARGELAAAAASSPALRAALSAAVYALAWPIVFARLTRNIELRRGHYVCMQSVRTLAPECLDRFHDDVEAVVVDALLHGGKPIRDLEGWIATRLTASTVNGHRKLRGYRGALQRPRVPKWLSAALGHDPWLVDLSCQILTWAGIPLTAGVGLWPLDSWAQQRALVTNDWPGSTTAAVEREIEVVLTAMRKRASWYASYVERPLGHKETPVVMVCATDERSAADLPALRLDDPAGTDDAHLADLAQEIASAIKTRLLDGEEPAAAVVSVIRTVFGQDDDVVADIDRAPHTAAAAGERVQALLGDPAELDRVVAAVLAIVDDLAV